MKNARTAALACLALAASVLLVGAAAWEGAAGVAAAGELGGEEYGIATNSFPRNTVVYVTNLENDMAVRALVVSGLDGTALLAELSRGAAESIGIGAESIARIRITHPSDEIAFAHVRRGPLPYHAVEAPDDPRDDYADHPAPDAALIAEPGADAKEEDPDLIAYDPGEECPGDKDGEIIAAACPCEEEADAEVCKLAAGDPEEADAIACLDAEGEDPDLIAYDPDLECPDAKSGEIVAAYPCDADPEACAVAVYEPEEKPEPTPEPPIAIACIVPPPNGPVNGNGNGNGARAEEPTVAINGAPRIYIPDFRLVAAEERLPPAREVVIPPEYIIPPIDTARPPAVSEPQPELPEAPPAHLAQPEQPPAPPEPQPELPEAPPAHLAQPEQPPTAPDPQPKTPPAHFNIVTDLQRGAWYVQLAAIPRLESVTYEIGRIGLAEHPYPMLLQSIGTEAEPMFRILLGPLSQGESAAVLRRVRSVGHSEAFVRRVN